MEEWRVIEDYPNYMVSNLGRVKSLNYNKTGKERIMKQGISKGYCRVVLYKDAKQKKYLVHRLVASAFLPNPNNYLCVNHKDENKQNNKVSNLEWCTQEYNINYGTRNERVGKANSILLKGKPNIALSKPILQLSKNGEYIKQWVSAVEASKELNISRPHICQCCNGKRKFCGGYRWEYLEEENKKVS